MKHNRAPLELYYLVLTSRPVGEKLNEELSDLQIICLQRRQISMNNNGAPLELNYRFIVTVILFLISINSFNTSLMSEYALPFVLSIITS